MMTPQRRLDVDRIIATFQHVERDLPTASRAVNTIDAMATLLAEVRCEERERCAEIAEAEGRRRVGSMDSVANVAALIAVDIRAADGQSTPEKP